MRKFAIVFIVGYWKGFHQVEYKAIVVIFVLIFSLILHVKMAPFITNRLNEFELKEIIACIFIVLAGLLSNFVSRFDAGIIIMVGLAVVNIYLFCKFIKEFSVIVLASIIKIKYLKIFERIIDKDLLGNF